MMNLSKDGKRTERKLRELEIMLVREQIQEELRTYLDDSIHPDDMDAICQIVVDNMDELIDV